MAQESGAGSTVSPRVKKYLKEAPFFCKIIQLVMCVIAVGLIVDPFKISRNLNFNHVGLVYIAIGGYIIINAIHIICYLYGERLGQKMGLMFARLGAVLNFAAGVVLIYDWKNYDENYVPVNLDQMLASGILAIIASVFFAVEFILLSREEDEEDK